MDLKGVLKGYLSRKFLMSSFILGSAYFLPISLHAHGLSDAIVMASLALVSGVGIAYGIVNIKDAKPNG
jgi:hypothetical protein